MIKKQNLFETMMILTVLLISARACLDITGELITELVFSIIIISLSGGLKIVAHQDLPCNNKRVLHGIATDYFYSSMLSLFMIYTGIIGDTSNVDGIYIWLTTVLFSITIPCVIICRVELDANDNILRSTFVKCFLIEIFIVGVIQRNVANKDLIMSIIYILLGISKILYFIVGKIIRELNTVKGRSYYNLFLIYNVIEYIILCIVKNREAIITIILAFQTIQIYCVLKSGDRSWRGEDTIVNNRSQDLDDSNELDKIIVNLSHELKTPVNIIKSALDLLMLDDKNNELEGDITKITSDCKQIMSVIQLMIDVESLKTGACIAKYKLYNMVVVVENVIDAIRSEYNQTTILFNPELEEMFSITDLKLFQESLTRLLVSIIDKFSITIAYITMNSLGEDKIEIKLFSAHSKQVAELLNDEKNIKYQEDIISILSVQYFMQVLDLTKGDIRYLSDSRNSCINIILCANEDKGVELEEIDSSNVQSLIEGIRYSYSMS